MDLYEFLQKTKDIDLKKLGIYIGEKANRIDSISCWRNEDGTWTMLKVDNRQREISRTGNEKDIIRKLYGNVELRL